jgi:hypothetical protein
MTDTAIIQRTASVRLSAWNGRRTPYPRDPTRDRQWIL